MSFITSVMYHYVRTIPDSRFPSLHGLSLKKFDAQLDYICNHYTVISMEMLIDSLYHRAELPPMPIVLSFDDGFIDHYNNVYPRLLERGISGSFYPPRMAVIDRKILDVHKIQFILASEENPSNIVKTIHQTCRDVSTSYRPGDINSYTYTHPFDSKEISYIKLLLGGEIPDLIRKNVIDSLFKQYVTDNSEAFAEDLYLSENQLKEMVSNGMHLGSHGDTHYWMDRMSKEEQKLDTRKSIELLRKIGMPDKYRSYCYPYGRYNQNTIDVLKDLKFKVGLTCIVDLINQVNINPLLLPRLDTNHLPQSAHTKISKWTKSAFTT